MKPLASQHKSIIQGVEYLVSGGVYFWVGYGAFALFYGVHTSSFNFNGLHWSLWWATIISNFIGWITNFLLQRDWVFTNSALSSHKTEVTWRYILITAIDFVLNYLTLLSMRQALHISPYVGQFISAAFFTIWNYFWYRFWVFPEKFPAGHKPKVTIMRLLTHRPHGHSSF